MSVSKLLHQVKATYFFRHFFLVPQKGLMKAFIHPVQVPRWAFNFTQRIKAKFKDLSGEI